MYAHSGLALKARSDNGVEQFDHLGHIGYVLTLASLKRRF
jgi:hypothetical protein